MNSFELREQTVTLLPERQALGRFSLTVAKVKAWNSATSVVAFSGGSSSAAVAVQTIVIG
jgi:hypothetical protein